MEKNTLKYLNSKVWYRLVKVIYCLMLGFSLLGLVLDSWHETSPEINYHSSYVLCDDGRKIFLNDNGIPYTMMDVTLMENTREIIEICSHDPGNPSDMERPNLEEAGKTPTPISSDNLDEIKNRLDINAEIEKVASQPSEPMEKNYKIVIVYSHNELMKMVGGILLNGIIILLIFEGVRRIFYYILLGSFKPKRG